MAKKRPLFFRISQFLLKGVSSVSLPRRVLRFIFLAVLSLLTNLLLLNFTLAASFLTSPLAPSPCAGRGFGGGVFTGCNTPYELVLKTGERIIAQNSSNVLDLVQQGRTFYETGRFSEAVAVWQQAATTFAAQGDVLNQAMVLSNLASAYQQLGQLEKGKDAIAQSLNLLKQSGLSNQNSKRILAQALNTQGNLQLALSQLELALNIFEQATATYKSVGDEVGVIRSQINQAQALQALGLYRRALTTLNQVNQHLQKQPDSFIKISGLRHLGNIYRVVGDLEQSRKVLQQSLDVAQQLNSFPDIAVTLFSLGNTAQAQQDNQAALEFYQQADFNSTSPILKLQAKLNKFIRFLESNKTTETPYLLQEIEKLLNGLPANRTTIYAKIELAHSLLEAQKNGRIETLSNLPNFQLSNLATLLATAIQDAKNLADQRALSYALGHLGELYEYNQQLSSAKDLTQEALLIAQAINAPDIAYRWQWQMGRLAKVQGNIKDAISSYIEAVKTLQSLRNDLVAINPEVQFNFRDEVEPIYRQLVDLLLQSPPGENSSQVKLIQARATIESLQLAELDDFFRVACLQGKPILVDQVIDKEDQTAAVFYPIILENRIEVILKLPNLPLRNYKTFLAHNEVENTLLKLRQTITKPYTLREAQSLSKQVYDWLIKPAEADLAKSNIKSLVFVLDGSLRNIPMSALYDGQEYLVQKYAVALTPGLQLLSPKSIETVKLKALTGGISESRQGFAALTNVDLELAQIQSEVPSTILLNQEFTTKSLQNEINSIPFPVIHLATHGQFSSKAEDTFILTWDTRINVKELDSLLRLREQNRNQAIELLVLSACETATGDKRAALGLAGVAVRAGARSTLASLWYLDDESSALLMSQFYRNLAPHTANKAEALRLAQLSLLQNPQYQHPRYWAPFVLVGNWL